MKRSIQLAFSFLTRLPAGRLGEPSDAEWQRCSGFFPLCGYVLAALAFVLPAVFLRRPPAEAPATFYLTLAAASVALLAWFTRGLHLDGLADTFDGFGGGYTPERRMEIMKDPATGSFGVIAIVLVLLAKVAAIAHVLAAGHLFSCVAVVVFSRFLLTLVTVLGRYPRSSGKAGRMIGKTPPSAIAMAGGIALPCLFAQGALGAWFCMALAALWLKRNSNRLIGGVTGDVLGAICEISETVGFMVLAFTL